MGYAAAINRSNLLKYQIKCKRGTKSRSLHPNPIANGKLMDVHCDKRSGFAT